MYAVTTGCCPLVRQVARLQVAQWKACDRVKLEKWVRSHEWRENFASRQLQRVEKSGR